jgi:tRNA threonylcarbamoyladenosine biosynthesis protein TsaB
VNNILALDTATATLGLCLRTASGLATDIIDIGLKHSQTLLPRIQDLLAKAELTAADLDLIVCSLGPGSFTGVRIGLATAKGLALGSGALLTGVSNLDGFAYRYSCFSGQVLPVLSGLRGRFYAAFYRGRERLSDYLDMSLDELTDRAARAAKQSALLLTGPHCAPLLERLQSRGPGGLRVEEQRSLSSDPRCLLEAGLAAATGPGKVDTNPRPLYLRKSDAEIKRG